MRIVLRIGGSVVGSPINPVLIKEYVCLLERLKDNGNEVTVVVGGGAYAREFIRAAKDLGLDERVQDEVAISVSRLYAQLFSMSLGEMGCENVPSSIEELIGCLGRGKIAVMGGLKPGMTTDSVAALIAEKIKADLLVKATDQDGVYDKNPKKHADAVKLDHLTLEDLSRVFDEEKHKAGIHQIIDPEAVRILKRGRIRVVIVNGFKPENVSAAIKGNNIGTLID